MKRRILIGDMRENWMPGSLPYLGWILPPRSACPPTLKRWPSEEAVDPSPQSPAKDVETAHSPVLPKLPNRFHLEHAMLVARPAWHRGFQSRIRPSCLNPGGWHLPEGG